METRHRSSTRRNRAVGAAPRNNRRNLPRAAGAPGPAPARAAVRRTCEEFLRLTDKSEPGFTVRVADIFIHAPGGFVRASEFPDLEEQIASYSANPVEKHRQHQRYLQTVFRGCEREIMNDPRVEYPDWRPYFSGRTGTMSQLIQNGHYIYYVYLLDHGIDSNILADALTLLTHLYQTADVSLFTPEEIRAIQTIFERARAAGFRLPSREWWDEEIRYLQGKLAIVQTKEAWPGIPEHMKLHRLEQWSVLEKNLPKNRVAQGIPKAADLGLHPYGSYDVYEYYPYKSDPLPSFEDAFAKKIRKLEFLRDRFSGAAGGRRLRRRASRRQRK